MESFNGEKRYERDYDCYEEFGSWSKKIDLTLKLSQYGGMPYGGMQEEGNVRRSSSLPSEVEADEKGLVWFGDLQRMRRAESVILQRQRSVVADSFDDFSHSGDLNHFQDDSYNNNISYLAPQHSTCNIQNLWSTDHNQDSYDFMFNSSNNTIPSIAYSSNINLEIRLERFMLENFCNMAGEVLEMLTQMPSVKTAGDGPNGKIMDGLLYNYMDGDVIIACICHGNLFNPEEFIAHAGGRP